MYVQLVEQSIDNTAGEFQHFLPNPNVLVAISKGMQAVKLCTNKILQWRCWLMQVDLYNGCKTLSQCCYAAGRKVLSTSERANTKNIVLIQ